MRRPLVTPEQIEAALRGPLPGVAAQMRMAPSGVQLLPPTDGHVPHQGGVLLLLFPSRECDDLCVVLTRRTENLAAHRGQMSFPGGGAEPDDRSMAVTALREACEEIGVCRDDVRLLGALTPVYILPSDFYVYPFVAYLPHPPVIRPEPAEVAEVLEVPLKHFFDAGNYVVEDRSIHGESVRVPYFDVHGHKVWGATAIVLSEFLAVVEGSWLKL